MGVDYREGPGEVDAEARVEASRVDRHQRGLVLSAVGLEECDVLGLDGVCVEDHREHGRGDEEGFEGGNLGSAGVSQFDTE